MKTTALLLLLFMAMGCQDDDALEYEQQLGCVTGIPKGSTSGERLYIGCYTRMKYNAGNNVDAGGVAALGNYTHWQFAPTKSCDDCK